MAEFQKHKMVQNWIIKSDEGYYGPHNRWFVQVQNALPFKDINEAIRVMDTLKVNGKVIMKHMVNAALG